MWEYIGIGIVLLLCVGSAIYAMLWSSEKSRVVNSRKRVNSLEVAIVTKVQGLSLDAAVPIAKSMAPGYSLQTVELQWNEKDGWAVPDEPGGIPEPRKTVILYHYPASKGNVVDGAVVVA